ncbi:hypothetical protein BJV77DRAFT_969101 [Russula vinacea]|nr:hypothetical protein BJV77DRAFT_969101 [Russula vinacea]
MVQWLRALPSRRLALSFVAPARLPPVRHVSYRLFPHPRPRFFRRPVFWLLPVAGGISLYFYPRPQLISSQLLSSPTLIPCPPHESPTSHETLILSPSEHEHIWEPILTARRFVHLFFLLFPERLQGDRWGAVWWYDYLVVQMDRAGPTFTKLAQFVPALLCERMGKMHSQGRTHSLAYTKRVIERVFQRPFDEVFEEFDETPIGSGAIAQVYRATMKQDLLPPSYFDPKRTPKKGPGALAPVILPESKPSVPTAAVAIKVLHPRVVKLIQRDLTIMSFFARLVTLFPGMEWVSLPEEVEKEADNLVTFERNFMSRKAPVTFPRPLQIWSTTDLLIEEYQNAIPLELFLKNGGGPTMINLQTRNMLLLDNFVHSDLHPGNIMVKFSRSTTSLVLKTLWSSFFDADNFPMIHESRVKCHRIGSQIPMPFPIAWRDKLQSLYHDGYLPELVFIDAGLVTTLNAKNRQNFLELFRAVAEFDGYRAGQLMVEHCRAPHLNAHIVLNIKRKTFSLGKVKISDILKDVLRAVRQHHVKMEGDFINTVISILLLEGIGRQLDPNLDLFKSALPILRQLGRKMTTQENMPNCQLWVVLEAREFAAAALVNADELIRYDLLSPSI